MLSESPVLPQQDTSARWQQALASGLGMILLIFCLRAALRAFSSQQLWLYFEQDDFFYYLKIAQNLAAGHGSTFNGIVPTNGYHPLYELLLTAACRLGIAGRGILALIGSLVCISTIACYALAVRLLRRSGVNLATSAVSAAFIAVFCAHIFGTGMEVTVTIPFMFGLLAAVQALADVALPSYTFRRGLGIGVLAALMILSRLDSMIFAGMLAAAFLAQPALRSRLNRSFATGVAVGLTPVLAYFVVNKTVFGLWMPVSSLAKQLKLDHHVSRLPWQTVLEQSRSQKADIILVAAVAAGLPLLWRHLRPVERALALSSLLFPFVHFALLSYLSDWRLWVWYFYSLRPALCIVFLVLLRLDPVRNLFRRTPAMAAFAVVALARMPSIAWQPSMPGIVNAARQLQIFAQSHPGIYAMGDRAGAVGYLLPYPVIQTEGLVMDRNFLDQIRQQAPLLDVLARYNVRYYVATSRKSYTGCLRAMEPTQGGPHARHMRSIICSQPLASWYYDGYHTWVFDVAQQTATPAR